MRDNHMENCPFCDSDAIDIRYNGSSSGRYYFVECSVCGGRTRAVRMPLKETDTQDEWDNDYVRRAVDLWNNRN